MGKEKDAKITEEVKSILKENRRRNDANNALFDPISGEGSIGEREWVFIEDFPFREQWLPVEMMGNPFVKKLVKSRSVYEFLESIGADPSFRSIDRAKVVEQFVRIRIKYDFAFWAGAFVKISNKSGGDDVLFRLTRPQRKFVNLLEEKRKAKKPIRIILLKARQWGGSTTSQLYIAWLQLVHKKGLNSLIIAHQGTATDEIKDMFDRMVKAYPTELLYKLGEDFDPDAPKLVSVGKSGAIYRVPQRNCKIKLGTAERPNSCRGGGYSLVHCSEVGIWKRTEGKTPQEIIQSACRGILYKPYTMIVYESTAKGTGTFFHKEWCAATDPESKSMFHPLFISWFDIDQYSLPFESKKEVLEFATNLYNNRNNLNVSSNREECGKYLWWLWEKGATLEAIKWYIIERSGCDDHGAMASEFPTDDIEAFVHSGARVFDKYKVENLKPSCKPPKFVGDIYADEDEGRGALRNLRFVPDAQGVLWVWDLPDDANLVEGKYIRQSNSDEIIQHRYLTVVDIGGRSNKADFSVITVFDRLFMMDGGKPAIVAQWYGHTDIDLLAWKAVQIAAYYENSLLVIESNTLETHDRERSVEGDQSNFILNQIKDVYDNLYARKQSEDAIREGLPLKYGFHTNVSTKPMIISNLVKVVREGMYIERDKRCLDEYETYEKKQNGAYGAIIGKHDDLLMTRAIGLHICFNEMELPTISKRITNVGFNQKMVSEATI